MASGGGSGDINWHSSRVSRIASPREIGAHHRVAAGRGVPFVEDEIEDAQHRVETGGDVPRLRHDVGDPRRLDLPLGAHQPLGHRRGRHQEGAGDFVGLEAAQRAQGQHDLRFEGQRRVAAGEDQPEPFVREVVGLGLGPGHRAQQRRIGVGSDLVGETGPPPQPIERLMPGGLDQPGAREFGDPGNGPLFDGGRKGFLRNLFGQVEVTQVADERGHYPAPFGPVDRIQRGGAAAHPVDRKKRRASCRSGHPPFDSLSRRRPSPSGRRRRRPRT